MEPKETSKKRFYLKWPWNVLVYITLVVLLRIFSIPLILLIMWWNKKQQPDGPEEGYCLQRTRGRLKELILAAIFAVGGGLAIWFFAVAETMPYEAERLKEEISFGYYLIPVAGTGAILVGLFLAYRSLRDALYPEKSALAQSIRDQLPYPDEAPPERRAGTPGPGTSPTARRRRCCGAGCGERSHPWTAGCAWSEPAAPGGL